MGKKWIPHDLEKGALRETVQRRFGDRGFTERGTIKSDVLCKLAKEQGITGERARFAKNLRK